MGIRQIRYCDITGTETDVEPHEIHVDQMRIAIDLAGSEYRRLIEALQPFFDAGRVEASAAATSALPDRTASQQSRSRRRASTSTGLTAAERDQLRRWAEARGFPVPVNNRFKQSLIDQWRADATSARQDPASAEPSPPPLHSGAPETDAASSG